MKKLIVIALMAVLLTGCKSAGRFSGIDWDSRSAEQLVASQPYDQAPFATGCVDNTARAEAAQAKAMPVGWWDGLMKMLTGIRVHIKVVTVEWGATK